MLSSLGITAGTDTPAGQLVTRLQAICRKGIMIGHQDDPVYGRSWKWDRGRSDVKDICGSYPTVMGFELGALELGEAKNLDGVPFDRMREEIIAQFERGGIVTISWHPYNPVTGKNAWDASGNAVREVLSGGSRHDKFVEWLQTVAGFLNSLVTPDGRKVPVIFRPWHEMNGDWFWWGSKSCTAAEYKQLFAFTYHELTERCKCDNLVWAYSPNTGYDDYLRFYPGSSYVDVLGVDVYDFNHDNATYQHNVEHDLADLQRIGSREGKFIALTETGAQTLPDANWFTQVFWPAASKYAISYVLFWRNAWDNPKELYMSAPGHPTEADFRRFAKKRKTLFVNDIKNIK